MDNLGSEVGQKMRSAVKAKLIELGTGGLSGYIDDELPDYVMIMIANKRSKQQMIEDLQLFLSSQTELFVTWLHEVLQKLQEVTLPAAVVHKTKRKSEASDAPPIVGKKEKKEKKKDKDKEKEKDKEKKVRKSSLSSSTTVATTTVVEINVKDSNPTSSSSAASISDVFAGHLLQKAKKTMQDEQLLSSKVKKGETSSSTNNKITRDEFDIPTITEISESVEEIQRKKDLDELSKLQKKIYQAKAKLKLTEAADESEDEDYLNIGEDAEELDEVVSTDKQDTKKPKRKPIVYDDTTNEKITENKLNENLKNDETNEFEKPFKKRMPIVFDDNHRHRKEELNKDKEVYQNKKRPIHERLGFNVKTSNNNETILPVFRRLDRIDREREKDKIKEKLHSRNSEKLENRIFSGIIDEENKEINKHKEKVINTDDNSLISVTSTIKRRIGSRVIIAPPKKVTNLEEENDDYTETSDKTLSSLIKIKPRPSISPSKQASKNLLLRAVAEAQKSTAFIQPKKDSSSSLDRSPKRLQNRRRRSPKLNTSRSYREHNRNRDTIKSRIGKDNIVIEIKSNKRTMMDDNENDFNENEEEEEHYKYEEYNRSNDDDDDDDNCDENIDEYVPEPIYRGDSDNDYVYIPQTINFDAVEDNASLKEYDDVDDEKHSHNKTQFVVTLGDKTREKYKTPQYKNRLLNKYLNGLGKDRSTTATKIDAKNNLKTSNSSSYDEDSCMSSPYDYSSPKRTTVTTTTTTATSTMSHEIDKQNSKSTSIKSRILNKITKDQVKKIIIQNDSDDDENLNLTPSPIKENRNEQNKEKEKEKVKEKTNNKNKDNVDGSLTPPLPPPRPPLKRKRSPITFNINDNNKNNSRNDIEKEKQNSYLKSTSSNDNNNTNEENIHQKISIKKIELTKKYDNIPESLNSVAVDVPKKIKERCKYFPSCSKGDNCEYFHPTTPCKAFPNCKFIEKCLYLHPKCKFDLTCNRINCNYSHSVPAITTTTTSSAAPPLSSHVVPVQNYKTISANALPAICKYYPNCTNSICNFYHPKLCRFGKNCMNKVECNFYHYDLPNKDKFKWVASLG